MKKKLFVLFMAVAMMVMIPGCGNKAESEAVDTDDEIVEANDPELDEVTTIDNIMGELEEDGYTKTDEGYVWENEEDGVKHKYTFTVDGNEVNMKGVLDYGADNDAMIKEFKEDPESIDTIPANFLMEFASLANTEDANMKYTMYIKDTKVRESTMTYDQADKILEDIDE